MIGYHNKILEPKNQDTKPKCDKIEDKTYRKRREKDGKEGKRKILKKNRRIFLSQYTNKFNR